jgi:hypothetical protein
MHSQVLLMPKSTSNLGKKSSGRPAVDSIQLNFRLKRDLLDGIDAYIAGDAGRPARTEAVRRIIRDWLLGHGYLDLPPPKEDAN